MAENLSQSELDYPFKLLEYFNGFRISKVTFMTCFRSVLFLPPAGICCTLVCCSRSLLDPLWTPNGASVWKNMKNNHFHANSHLRKLEKNKQTWKLVSANEDK